MPPSPPPLRNPRADIPIPLSSSHHDDPLNEFKRTRQLEELRFQLDTEKGRSREVKKRLETLEKEFDSYRLKSKASERRLQQSLEEARDRYRSLTSAIDEDKLRSEIRERRRYDALKAELDDLQISSARIERGLRSELDDFRRARSVNLQNFTGPNGRASSHPGPLLPEEVEQRAACPICLEIVDSNNGARVLECSHVMHRSCLDRLRQRGATTCPICRAHL